MKNVVILYIVLLVGCAGGAKHSDQSFDTLYAPRYAKHFVILSRGDSTILRVVNPWQGASDVSYDYALREPQRVVCMSSSHAAFLDTLGAAHKVVGVSAPGYYSNDRFANLPDVGFDNSLNMELLVSLAPDVMTAYALSSEIVAVEQKLAVFGVQMIYVADYLEDDPLGRAEWVVAFGALVGQMDRAREIFAGVDERYNELKEAVRTAGVAPLRVMLNSPYKGVWYLPGDSSYMVRMVNDAAGEYVGKGSADNISRTVSTEVAYSKLIEADVWLNPSGQINSVAQLRAESPLLRDLKIPVYNNTLRGGVQGGSDFWEGGVIRPDVVLADLVRILHPELIEEHTLHYYKELR